MNEIEKNKTKRKQATKKKDNVKTIKKVNNTDQKKKEKIITKDKIKQTDNKLELLKNKKNKVLLLLVLIITIVLLVFLTNKSFFRKVYKTSDLEINLPFFTYFVSDKENVITFKSLRKSEYLKQYFDEYLSNLKDFDYYICGNDKTFYYNEEQNLMIFDISVEKKFALKTIKIFYDIRPIERVCL